MSTTLLAFYLTTRGAVAAPTENRTALQNEFAPTWVPEPERRGTWALLYSCLFTLGLCVWSAIHLNIPRRGEPAIKQFLRKTKWVLIAVFAPEFVVFSAWQQYFDAQMFCKLANQVVADEGARFGPTDFREHSEYASDSAASHRSSVSLSSDRSKPAKTPQAEPVASFRTSFSLVFGFYVIMGGFSINVSDMYDEVDTLTLSSGAVREFLRRGWMSGLEIADCGIQDKSKRDYLAKGLVILQVSWMLLQTISRKASGLPISVLEIHTLVHAGCALIIFCCWWNKPYEIRDATMVSTDSFRDDLALMLATCRSRHIELPHGDVLDQPSQYFGQEAAFLAFQACSPQDLGEQKNGEDECSSNTRALRQPDLAGHDGLTDPCTSDMRSSNTVGIPREVCSNQAVARSLTPCNEESGSTLESKVVLRPVHAGAKSAASIVRILRSGELLPSGIGPSFVPVRIHTPRRPKRHRSDKVGPTLLTRLRTEVALVLSSKFPWVEWSPEHLPQVQPCVIEMHLSSKDVIRLDRCASAMRKRGDAGCTYVPLGEYDRWIYNLSWFHSRMLNADLGALEHALGDSIEGPPDRASIIMLNSLVCLGALYASVHLALWRATFPTNVEALLWKISACTLAAMPALLVVVNVFALMLHAYDRCFKAWSKEGEIRSRAPSIAIFLQDVTMLFLQPVFVLLRRLLRTVVHYRVALPSDTRLICSVLLQAMALFYGLARVYIVVESFLSLRKVPVGVYAATNWAQYIPHL